MPERARLDSPLPEPSDPDSESKLHVPSETRIAVAARTAKPSADYNLRIVAPLIGYVRDHYGEAEVARLAVDAHLDPTELSHLTGWMSWEQCEAVLDAIHTLVGAEAYENACAHKFGESWGPFKYIAWALTPLFMYEGAPRANKTLSAVAAFKVEGKNARRAVITYTTSKKESRLLCTTRRVALANLTTFFDLPVARVTEKKCVAHGDGCCEYDVMWAEQRRWLPAVAGALAGAGMAAAFYWSELPSVVMFMLFPAFGAALGQLLERNRNARANVANFDDANNALQRIIMQEAEARREMVALHERQREWERALELAHSARVGAMQGVLKRAEQMQAERETTLLGFSHDLRNPLMVLASTVDFLRDNGDALGDEAPEIIADVEASIEQMKRMLGDFVAAATDQELVRLSPKRLETTVLTASLTRRLRALVQGRPIVPSVMQTREAPDAIMLDPIVFDRVTDNLLTNASKYTERGSIVVEMGGTPRSVIVKVSDSGRGIAEEDLVRIFTANGSPKAGRAGDSYGVGLSVILQLLEQVGGLLEVQSALGKGTTFW
ncbi:MAG: HAMP domain-containing sensor histidine kinase, partial [Polyangiaceae bacterium]